MGNKTAENKACIVFAAGKSGLSNLSKLSQPALSSDAELGRYSFSEEDFKIAVDGGFYKASNLNLDVDLLLGDFDSLDFTALSERENDIIKNAENIKLPVQKDDTDLMFAARHIIREGFTQALFIGLGGGRLDHILGNLAVLKYLVNEGVLCRVISDDDEFYMLKPGKYTFKKMGYSYFSLMPYFGEVTGVNIKGAEYPLVNAVLRDDFPVGVSNSFLKSESGSVVEFSFEKGILIFYLTKN